MKNSETPTIEQDISDWIVANYPELVYDDINEMYWDCPNGWREVVESTIQTLALLNKVTTGARVGICQIKQKFGELRIYVDFSDTENDPNYNDFRKLIYNIITYAEHQCEKTCESTGKYGVLCSRGGWLRTLHPRVAKETGYIPLSRNRELYSELSEEIPTEDL